MRHIINDDDYLKEATPARRETRWPGNISEYISWKNCGTVLCSCRLVPLSLCAWGRWMQAVEIWSAIPRLRSFRSEPEPSMNIRPLLSVLLRISSRLKWSTPICSSGFRPQESRAEEIPSIIPDRFKRCFMLIQIFSFHTSSPSLSRQDRTCIWDQWIFLSNNA